MPSWLTLMIIVLVGVALFADLRRNDADELADVVGRRGTPDDHADPLVRRTSATFSRTVIAERCLARSTRGGSGRTSASTAEAPLRRDDAAGTDQAPAVAGSPSRTTSTFRPVCGACTIRPRPR